MTARKSLSIYLLYSLSIPMLAVYLIARIASNIDLPSFFLKGFYISLFILAFLVPIVIGSLLSFIYNRFREKEKRSFKKSPIWVTSLLISIFYIGLFIFALFLKNQFMHTCLTYPLDESYTFESTPQSCNMLFFEELHRMALAAK